MPDTATAADKAADERAKAAEKKAAEERAKAEKIQAEQEKVNAKAARDKGTVDAIQAVINAFYRAEGNGAHHTLAEIDAINQLRDAFDWKPVAIDGDRIAA